MWWDLSKINGKISKTKNILEKKAKEWFSFIKKSSSVSLRGPNYNTDVQ